MGAIGKWLFVAALVLVLVTGCTTVKSTDTSRTGLEQLLISNAVDQALDKFSFTAFAAKSVHLNEKLLNCTDKEYIIGSVRHRLLRAGARLVEKPEEADIVCEVRSGGVGTDRRETMIGIPKIQLPFPLSVSTPQVSFWERNTQKGTAKIGLVAYDAKTKEAVGEGGLALARADDSNTFFFGMGPRNRGHIKKEIEVGTGQVEGLEVYNEDAGVYARRGYQSVVHLGPARGNGPGGGSSVAAMPASYPANPSEYPTAAPPLPTVAAPAAPPASGYFNGPPLVR